MRGLRYGHGKRSCPHDREILGDADALIRRRLKLQALRLSTSFWPCGVRSDGLGIIRSNVASGGLTEIAEMVQDIAEKAETPPADEDTKH